MKCSVSGCNNTSKSKGISVHPFPSEPALRNAWLQVLGREGMDGTWKGTVCSEHFRYEDFIQGMNGCKVKDYAVPAAHLTKKYELDKLPVVEVCRVCLAMDTKMFNMFKYDLQQRFEQVTGIRLFEKERLPHGLCFECARCMVNSFEFQQKSARANVLMLKLIQTEGALSYQNVQKIDRKNHLLASNLRIKRFGADYCDIQIGEVEEGVKLEEAPVEIKFDVTTDYLEEIKEEDTAAYKEELEHQETADYFEENENDTAALRVDIANEERNETNDSINNSVHEPDDDNSHVNIHDQDNIAGYSNDDSLPLAATKTKKDIVKLKKDTKRVGKKAKKELRKPKKESYFSDLFTLHDLTAEEQLADIEKRKESSNYKNSVHKCSHCYKGFADVNAYNSHMLRHTNKCGEYKCGICKKYYKTKPAIRHHVTTNHSQRYSCNQCEYVSTCTTSARLHAQWHKGTKYTCPHCEETFLKKTSRFSHIRIKHPSDFVCQLCGFSYIGEKGLWQHKNLKHNILQDVPIPEDGPLCDLCDIRFINVAALNKHLSISPKHTDKGSRVRNEPKSKITRNDRQIVKKKISRCSEVKKGPIPCEQCGIQFDGKRKYHNHLKRMHPDKNRTNDPAMKPFMCEHCGKMFPSITHLRQHRWVHTGERLFKCESCGKSFSTKHCLFAHRQIHGEQKTTYACEVCGKLFKWYNNRQRHMLIHTGVKPCKCELCGKAFNFPSEKRTHIAHTHLKKPWPKPNRGKRVPKKKKVKIVSEQLPDAELDGQD